MKKIRKIIGILLLLVGMVLGIPTSLEAKEDAGYVYDRLQVNVEINEQREYHITEIMDLNFKTSMHGIVRTIPKSSGVESYEIKDIRVEGMNAKVDDRQSHTKVIIGDENKQIKGKQRVVLHYTLAHYRDYDSSADYAYLNLLGSDYDCEIKDFQADVKFPSSQDLQSYTLTSGEKGSKENAYVRGSVQGDTLHVRSNKALPAKHGVTLQLKFKEGVFASAPQYPFPYIIENSNVDIRVDEEQNFFMEQSFLIRTQEQYAHISLPMISAYWDEGDYRIEQVECNDQDVTYSGGKWFSMYSHKIETKEIKVRYQIHPYHIFKKELSFNFFTDEEDTQLKDLHMTLHLPYEIKTSDVLIQSGREGDTKQSQRYQFASNGSTLTLITNDDINAGEQFQLILPVKSGVFHRSSSSYKKIGYAVCIAFLLMVLILRFVIFKKHDLIIPVNFYPPKQMNPAEAGYVIDLDLSDNDVTSLIYYWADKGWLKISDVNAKYWFTKLKEPDASTPSYEKELFHAMFSYGKNDNVTKDDLMNRFFKDIRKAKEKIRLQYQGNHALYSGMRKRIRTLLMVSAMLPLVVMNTMNHMEVYGNLFHALLSNAAFLPFYILLYVLLRMLKKSKEGNISKTVFPIVMVIYSILMVISALPGLVIVNSFDLGILLAIAVTALCAFLSSQININSRYRNELLSNLLGFREFIELAEKDQLEALLNEDPEYYYHVLPYAQVLHVSEIWEQKFRALQVEPPKWYDSEEPFEYTTFVHTIHTLHYAVASSPTTSSASSYDQGSFSGGGSGFSGGGSVGGGSGGGGSHGW